LHRSTDVQAVLSPLSDEADINRQNLCVERLGEAASKISADTKARYSDIPWREIVGMRHRLIHGYGDVRLDLIWKVAHEHLVR